MGRRVETPLSGNQKLRTYLTEKGNDFPSALRRSVTMERNNLLFLSNNTTYIMFIKMKINIVSFLIYKGLVCIKTIKQTNHKLLTDLIICYKILILVE